MPGGDVELPERYGAVLAAVKRQVREARFRAQRIVNTELIRLYWQIGGLCWTRGSRNGGAAVL